MRTHKHPTHMITELLLSWMAIKEDHSHLCIEYMLNSLGVINAVFF